MFAMSSNSSTNKIVTGISTEHKMGDNGHEH